MWAENSKERLPICDRIEMFIEKALEKKWSMARTLITAARFNAGFLDRRSRVAGLQLFWTEAFPQALFRFHIIFCGTNFRDRFTITTTITTTFFDELYIGRPFQFNLISKLMKTPHFFHGLLMGAQVRFYFENDPDKLFDNSPELRKELVWCRLQVDFCLEYEGP